MSWFYTAKLAGPAGEVKEMWISPATCPAPLPAAPERSGISQPSDVNKALVLTKPPGSTMYLGGPPCGWANPEVQPGSRELWNYLRMWSEYPGGCTEQAEGPSCLPWLLSAEEHFSLLLLPVQEELVLQLPFLSSQTSEEGRKESHSIQQIYT